MKQEVEECIIWNSLSLREKHELVLDMQARYNTRFPEPPSVYHDESVEVDDSEFLDSLGFGCDFGIGNEVKRDFDGFYVKKFCLVESSHY